VAVRDVFFMAMCSANHCTPPPMFTAAESGNLDLIRSLFADGHSVNMINMDLMTPLHVASHSGHAHCIQGLLQLGANVRRINSIIG